MNKKIREAVSKIKEKVDKLKKKDIRKLAKTKLDKITSKKTSSAIAIGVLVLLFLTVFFLLLLYVRVGRPGMPMHIKVSGNIEGTEVRISFRVEGQILQLLTDEGMVLRVGDIVARLNTDELGRMQAEKTAAFKKSEYDHKLARDNHIRAKNLYIEGSISDQEREVAEMKADAARSAMEQTLADLELANTRLGFTNLAAPLNGFVLAKSAEAGEVVRVGAPVFTAIDLNDIWLTAYVNERDLGKVKLNQKAYVVNDSFPEKKYPGWVSFISQEAEFTPKYIQTNMERVKLVYRIKVRVDNSSLELKPGMPGDGFIILE